MKGSLRDLIAGLAVGGLLIGLVVAGLALAGWYRVVEFSWNGSLLFSSLLSWLLVAVREEVYFRAVAFRSIEEYLGSWLSLAVSAALFGLAHRINPGATWSSSAAIAIEAGILLGAAYMLTRSLWLAVGIHWGWNLFQGTIFGAPVSGHAIPSLIKAELAGPEWATGGPFGPEAGLFAVLLCTLAGIGLAWWAVRRKHVAQPFWRKAA